ncbi:hypothetical protein TVAGG3_0301750 [Trichomonas vaginalis G3]|uniref:hypothetical protein n=1 Tax=Trichomonas vaginalis (strain ATCC PRA-98 / G3) TaxID=412133 RepID=UPI0021E5C251|nr:hypothetical protein TVAGG3_0301750 [Trichomonas vaginalis G3]KAI5527941.1 hypothetical protein TVAGG3_0301750 [Trichomonas vaginalis G3]
MEGQFIVDKEIGSGSNKTNPPGFWIGFDDAFYAVAGYQILANGRIVYSQDNAREEAYITSNSQTTEQIKKVDVFSKTRHEDVWSHSGTCRTGQIVSGPITAGKSFDFKLRLRIPVRKFLPLEAIRFIPAFAGNIQLKVKFSSDALQCTSISVNDIIAFNPTLKVAFDSDSNPPTNKFVPWNEPFTMITKAIEASGTVTITTVTQQLFRTKMDFNECFIHPKSFSLDPNIYTELVEHYTNEALCFPVKVMDWIPMDGSFSRIQIVQVQHLQQLIRLLMLKVFGHYLERKTTIMLILRTLSLNIFSFPWELMEICLQNLKNHMDLYFMKWLRTPAIQTMI